MDCYSSSCFNNTFQNDFVCTKQSCSILLSIVKVCFHEHANSFSVAALTHDVSLAFWVSVAERHTKTSNSLFTGSRCV